MLLSMTVNEYIQLPYRRREKIPNRKPLRKVFRAVVSSKIDVHDESIAKRISVILSSF